MYFDLFELPVQFNGRKFFVQWETEEQHYRIEFIDNPGRPMLIMQDDAGKWFDLADKNHSFAAQLGEFLKSPETAVLILEGKK